MSHKKLCCLCNFYGTFCISYGININNNAYFLGSRSEIESFLVRKGLTPFSRGNKLHLSCFLKVPRASVESLGYYYSRVPKQSIRYPWVLVEGSTDYAQRKFIVTNFQRMQARKLRSIYLFQMHRNTCISDM